MIKFMDTIKLNIYWIAKLSNGITVEGRRSSIERIATNIKLQINNIVPSFSDEGKVMYFKASSQYLT